MIWFSGYPFLDNKEEHVFNVPVSQAMTSNPLSLPVSEFPVSEAERILRENKYQGFPIVENNQTKTLVGYIGRTELRYAIDRARSEGFLSSVHVQCAFTREAADAAVARRAAAASASQQEQRRNQLVSEMDNDDDNIDTAGNNNNNTVDFSRYVDHTALTVSPGLALETVMEIFKKMGPRVILIEQRGQLTGLVTVKDCLKYQFTVEAQEGSGEVRGGTTNTNTNLEDRIWGFMQWVGDRLRVFHGSGHGSHGPAADRILDGTEQEEERVELQERDTIN